MWQFRKRPPYSQEEIAEQIGQIADMMKMRKSSQILDEVARFTGEIEMAQIVLQYMLEMNSDCFAVKSVV